MTITFYYKEAIMTYLYTIVLISITIALTSMAVYITYREIDRNFNKKIRDLDILLSILNETIDRELLFRLTIDRGFGKKNFIIRDFEKELTVISKAILNSFNIEFIDEIKYYYTEEYLLRYIIKTVQIYMIKHIDENKIETK